MSGEHAILKRIPKRLPVVVGAVIVVIITALVARGKTPVTSTKHQADPVISVKTITLDKSVIPDDATASGTVRPIVESKIAPKIMSTVAAVYVREGDHVQAGQVLIRLESRDLQAQLSQSEAALAAAAAGSGRAYTAIDLQKAQTSTSIASATAALQAAREQLSLVKAGPRKQQRAQAHLAVVQADAQMKNAKDDLARMKWLYDQGAIPKQQLDSAQTHYDIAKAAYDSSVEQANMTDEGSRTQEIQAAEQQVRQAEEALRMAKASVVQNKMSVSNAHVAASQVAQARAAVEYARTQLGYATIISPITGVISQRLVDPGDTVSPGVPVIAVQADSNYRLEATVPEKYVENVYIGKPVNVIIGSEDKSAEGKIAVISPAGDPSSHKFVVKVDLPASLNARSGQFGRISFPVSYSHGVIIPQVALHDEGGLPTVFIVDRQNRARMQAVKVGRTMGRGVEILSGLQAGDRVIVDNTGVLADGASIRIEGL